MVPNVAEIHVCAISDPILWNDYVGYWSDVEGFDMCSMIDLTLRDVQIKSIKSESIKTNIVELKVMIN